MYNYLMQNLRRTGLILYFILVLSLLTSKTGTALPSPLMTILTPGDGSVVTAPIHVSAEVQPGTDDLIRLTLTDQNNNVIARQLLRIEADNQSPIQFETWLSYEIPKESTQALLTLATQDTYHRPETLRSALLTLKSSGEAVIQSHQTEDQWLTITYPEPLDIISGGQFLVSGTVTPLTENPIFFELITDSGGVVGSSQLAVPAVGEPFDFEMPLSYAFITSNRDVRLVIRQTIDTYATNIILDSLPLTLTP